MTILAVIVMFWNNVNLYGSKTTRAERTIMELFWNNVNFMVPKQDGKNMKIEKCFGIM